jgi:hypothetical protein
VKQYLIFIDTVLQPQPDPTVSGNGKNGDGIFILHNDNMWLDVVTVDFGSRPRLVIPDLGYNRLQYHNQFNLDGDYPAGIYDFELHYSDDVGNTYVGYHQMEIRPDFLQAPTIDFPEAHSTGEAWMGNTDNFSLTGTADPGVTVKITRSGVNMGTVIADNDGNWSLDISDDADLSFALFSIAFKDQFGNQQDETHFVFFSDENPTVTLDVEGDADADAGYLINSDETTLSGTLDQPNVAASGLPEATEITVVVNGVSHTVPVDPNQGTWSLAVTGLNEGDNTISLSASTYFGNSVTVSHTVSVDTSTFGDGDLTDASDTGASQDDYYTDDTTPRFEGTGEEDAVVHVTIRDSQNEVAFYDTVTVKNGTWALDVAPALAEGTYSYDVILEDLAGNQQTIANAQSLVIDTSTHGTADLADASDTGVSQEDFVTSEVMPTFEGGGEDGATVRLTIRDDSGQVVVDETDIINAGAWSIDVLSPLMAGEYNYDVVVVDTLGNAETIASSQGLVVDTSINGAGDLTAASDTGTAQDDGITNLPTPSFSGTGEPDATVTLTLTGVGGGRVETTDVDEHGNWTIDIDGQNPLAEGDYTYDLEIEDLAGNTQTLLSNASLTIDSTAPNSTFNYAVRENPDQITVDGVTDPSEEGAVVTVTINGSQEGQTTVDDQGNWAVSVDTSNLDPEQYNVGVTLYDYAGNSLSDDHNATIV